jgi:hypothetical protein
MKQFILSFILLTSLTLSAFGQSPEGFKYQAVVRDASYAIIANQAIGMQISILQGSTTGAVIYQEQFASTTNSYGMVNLEIGTGVTTEDFSAIDWSNGPYFMKTAIDVTGGSVYADLGTSQLMSVPYALYAKTSGNGQGPAGTDGIDGAVGPTGATGPEGPTGATGVAGTDGAPGAQGSAGNDGVDGINGTVGATGPAGATGLTGPLGLTGATGLAGLAGAQGIQGATGLTGAAGAQGATSPQGLTGSQGTTGPQGATGTTGSQGIQGLIGATGTTGTNGNTGATGPAGSGYPVHTIGESYGGGIVFYVYDGGQHGLIAATANQSAAIRWYGGTNTNTRAKADGVGAGLKNTAIIIANQGPVDGGAFAATVCNEYSVTVGGVTYDDWYLPSKHELNLLYLQRNVVGGFAGNAYWSSTEFDNYSAWFQYFVNGNQDNLNKVYNYYVRAVRAF